MTRAALATLAVLMPLAAAADSMVTTAAGDVDQVVGGLQARYDATNSFKAAFQQEIESRALGQKLVSSGMIYYRRPGRMRWDFGNRDRQTVIADGTTLWIYQKPEHQVIKLPLDSAFRTTTPMSFLIGLGEISSDFEARLAPSTASGAVVLRLRSRASGADVGELELELTAETYDIIGALVTDATGGTTRWKFSDLERNIDLGDDLFEFVVPAGVDVVVPPS